MTPEVGLELVNPVVGTRVVFLATATSTDGAHVEVEQTYPPHSAAPPTHLHPSQDEHFTVLAGRLRIRSACCSRFPRRVVAREALRTASATTGRGKWGGRVPCAAVRAAQTN